MKQTRDEREEKNKTKQKREVSETIFESSLSCATVACGGGKRSFSFLAFTNNCHFDDLSIILCDASYAGNTLRRFHQRADEHLPFSVHCRASTNIFCPLPCKN